MITREKSYTYLEFCYTANLGAIPELSFYESQILISSNGEGQLGIWWSAIGFPLLGLPAVAAYMALLYSFFKRPFARISIR